jgi:hypothetical protein
MLVELRDDSNCGLGTKTTSCTHLMFVLLQCKYALVFGQPCNQATETGVLGLGLLHLRLPSIPLQEPQKPHSITQRKNRS